MNLTEEDIAKLGENFKESLRHGQAELGQDAPTISVMQSWMIKHNVEHPEVFKTMLNKLGTGTRAGKENIEIHLILYNPRKPRRIQGKQAWDCFSRGRH